MLNYWQLVDSGGGTVIAFICVPNRVSARLQMTVLNLRPHRLHLLKSVCHKTKQTGINVERGSLEGMETTEVEGKRATVRVN